MKVDFNAVMVDLDGKPIPSEQREDSPSLTLEMVACSALLHQNPGEDIPGDKKADRWALAITIKKSDTKVIDLTAERIVELKELINRIYLPIIVGQAFYILDGKEV